MTSITKLRAFRRETCRRRLLHAATFVAFAMLLQGCAERRTHAYPWASASAAKPVLRRPIVPPVGNLPSLDDAPDLHWDFPPPPSRLVVVRQPARPRTAAASATDPAATSKPDPLSFEPQLSPTEIAAAQQQWNDSLGVAQKNLTNARRRRLNPTQTDLASKVDSFTQESKNAAREGDWNRAKNLAKKAQVLSEELMDSL
jgi:hypothetical protein